MSLECLKWEDNFCCIYLGQKICSIHCRRQSCFCMSCQLYNIEEKSPTVICQKCSLLLECYGYKYLGSVNGRDSYNLQRHCIDHCRIEGCPHRHETTVELNRVIPPPDYSHLVQNGGPSKTTHVYQQGTGTQQYKDRKTPIPSGKAYPRMVRRILKKDRGRLKGLLATIRAKRARGSRRGSGGN